jgi:hypothetical protein
VHYVLLHQMKSCLMNASLGLLRMSNVYGVSTDTVGYVYFV